MLRNILYIAFAAILFTACNDELDKINENPNATENPDPAYLLTGVLKQGADLYWGGNASINSTLLFVQHWARIQQTEPDRYYFSTSDLAGLWDTGYSTLITDLNVVLDMDEDRANANYKGIALALRSWVFQLITELYGDAPYTEAGKSIIPKYDKQESIYNALIGDLDEALSLLDENGDAISGDVVYGGDITLWKKLANSLKLRIGLRIADRNSDLARSVIQEAVNSSYGLISDNNEIFQFIYTVSPQHNPQSAAFDTRDDHRISKTIVERLKELSDPRLPVFAQLPENGTDYNGAANGLMDDAASAQGFTNLSKPGTYFLRPEAPAVIYSYSEILFNLSEAVARGFISGDAETYYKDAIAASFHQFGITDLGIIDEYLSQPQVTYDDTNYKKSIGEQKWIAFFGQGLDAFTEWRRLDYPQLTAGPSSVLNGALPLRFLYPATEQTLNSENYKTVLESQGDNVLTTRLWFDVY